MLSVTCLSRVVVREFLTVLDTSVGRGDTTPRHGFRTTFPKYDRGGDDGQVTLRME